MGAQLPADATSSVYVRSLIRFKARQLCRKRGFTPSDREDVAQELRMALLEKARLYDPTRGASFDTFADRVICSKVKMILRDRGRQKRAAGFTAASLDADGKEGGNAQAPLSHTIDSESRARRGVSGMSNPLEEMDQQEALGRVVAALPPPLAQLAHQLAQGSVVQAGRQCGLSRRKTAALICELRQRLEAAGLCPK
jgi:RNA polymerase sigma-70 factor (ECF subfamily)